MKKYKLINNTLGWLIFLVAAVTYLLTIEPTASFWDCPEFIAQGYKTEIGHPPGNPIFILAANFASHFAANAMEVAMWVNRMSAIFSALTILLLFWSITHLVRKLVVRDSDVDKMTLAQYLVVMGSGICGALVYTWSDTFWFSAVEAEVYAFSSFCTALVFWLILKWEDQADKPGSDRWLILIAYVIGVSLGVHLLNLLCIPAIALIFYYRQCRRMDKKSTAKGSLLTLLVSFVIVGLILYGLEPGFVEMGQYFDLLFVNVLGMSFNSGVLFYAILFIGILAWCIWELYSNKSKIRIKASFALAILFSGMLFMGDSPFIPILLYIGLCVYLLKYCKRIPVRVFTNIAMCILSIFIGFSCYALILIRSSQNTPLDENSPNNTFALAGYLSREQYGQAPLLYGRTLFSDVMHFSDGRPATSDGRTKYVSKVKSDPNDKDEYQNLGSQKDYLYSPELNMVFPRMYNGDLAKEYDSWVGGIEGTEVEATTFIDDEGNSLETEVKIKPTMMENLKFFITYQCNYMYWRYFMWNFAGRQNDYQGYGASDITHGNWVSGISFIDNPRLGDQSLLPNDLGKGNKGHNVFYMLPLLLGIIGLLWQAFRSKRGIEQFWVIAFLFFMTGLAIVFYLNQTPNQPRERDYAYAGSFYAFSIWVGMGVAGLWGIVMSVINQNKKAKKADDEEKQLDAASNDETATNGNNKVASAIIAAIAAIIGILVPLQMVSQTWDDHDRSGRTAARDFGRNYLSSLAPNAIIFCNGDNDTFPLWYLQEVEGYRTDVRAVNLSYLTADWYIRQMRRAAYESAPLPMQANDETYAYERRQGSYVYNPDPTPTEALKSLAHIYSPAGLMSGEAYEFGIIRYPNVYIPIDADQAIKAGIIKKDMRSLITDTIHMDLQQIGGGFLNSSQLMSFDIITSSIAQVWNRPCYFAMTVPENYYLGFKPYMRLTGFAYQVTPIADGLGVSTDVMYENVTKKFLWGGIDKAEPGSLYLDETVRRMVTTTRSAMLDLAQALIQEGLWVQKDNYPNPLDEPLDPSIANNPKRIKYPIPEGMTADTYAADRFKKAHEILDLMMKKLPIASCPFTAWIGEQVAQIYLILGKFNDDTVATAQGNKILEDEIMRYSQYIIFYQKLTRDQKKNLPDSDKSIQAYFIHLLDDYLTYTDKQKFQDMAEKVRAAGVDMKPIMSELETYWGSKQMETRQRMAQMQAAQMQAQQQAQAARNDSN